MYTMQPKKMLIVHILDILNQYSDENHRLSQKDIADILKKEYLMQVDRKAIKRNLMNLLEFGYEIEYTKSERTNKRGETETILTNFYINHKFTNAQLRLMIDSLLFFRNIEQPQRKELIEKLESLSNKYFHSKVSSINSLATKQLGNKELFYTIEILDEAIHTQRQVQFKYTTMGIDKALHPRLKSDGTAREYLINPYQMAAVDGHYYLICNLDAYDDISNYRIDRIKDIKLLPSKRKPLAQTIAKKDSIDLSKYLEQHIYMFAGTCETVTFRIHRDLLNELFDWFGGNIEFFDITEQDISVRVTANAEAMRFWALQYAPYVTILAPQTLVDTVKENLKQACEHYGV